MAQSKEAAIDLVAFFAPSLIESAIQQNLLTIDFQQMLGASGSACRTAKGDFHVLHSRLGNPTRQGAKVKKHTDFFGLEDEFF